MQAGLYPTFDAAPAYVGHGVGVQPQLRRNAGVAIAVVGGQQDQSALERPRPSFALASKRQQLFAFLRAELDNVLLQRLLLATPLGKDTLTPYLGCFNVALY